MLNLFNLISRHPLFPLLALLFEKCEIATQSNECVASDSFNLDIQAFVQHQERDRKPFLLNDPEVDGLVSRLGQTQVKFCKLMIYYHIKVIRRQIFI